MNEIQQIQVSTTGAELTSLVANGREYLWQGDPKFWGRRAPILFPIVGRLANDMLRIDGVEYMMKQHGFARDAEFVQIGENQFDMVKCSHANYPYNFDLEVTYKVNVNVLSCGWIVKNYSDKTMYFQIGAHPAFVLSDYSPSNIMHGYFRCYNSQGQMVLPITSSHLEDGLRVFQEPKEVENKKGQIPITNILFANDAILLDGGNISSIGLLDTKGNEVLRVSCPQAQVFGLWAPNKPECPFVCIEPWCGVADRQGFSGDISERDCIQKLEPEHIFSFDYSITILG